MSVMPGITLVVPILNEEDTLPQLLKGIRGQHLQPDEIIIVDSGSSDASLDTVRYWSESLSTDSPVVRIVINPGGMPGSNRNRGVEAASCEWVAFLDAGVVPEPDWLERLWHCCAEWRTVSATGYARFQATGAFQSAVCALSYGMGACVPVLPASLFHCSVFEEVGPFREDLRAAEDLLWRRSLKERYGGEFLCEGAVVHYAQFPSTVGGVARKWWVYEKHTCLAGIKIMHKRLLLLLLLALLAFCALYPLFGAMFIAAYAWMRGVIDPIRRSRNLLWWRQNILAAFIAVPLAMVIDGVKFASWSVALYIDAPILWMKKLLDA